MRKLALLILLLTLPVLRASAQAVVSGIVRDEVTGEPLPAVNVQILGTLRGAGTDASGRFSIEGVEPGSYALRASLVGYASRIVPDVVVGTGRPPDLVVELTPVELTLGEVEVTGTYFRKSPDAPVSIQRLSYEEIRRSPGGFEDVLRAISILPGVAQPEPGRNDLVVRGGAPGENLFILDGFEVANINHFGTQGSGGGPLSYINLDFVRETAFSTGGFGVRYGDRLSSVLSIDLREGRSDRLGGKATLSATQFGLNLEGPLEGSGSYSFSARRSYLDFIFKAAGFGFVPEYWDFYGRASYPLGERDRLTVLGIGALNDVSFFNDDADQRFENSRVLGTDQRQALVGVSWRRLLPRGVLTASVSYNGIRYNGVQRDSTLRPLFTNVSTEGEWRARGEVVLQPGAGTEVSFGGSLKRASLDAAIGLPGFVSSFGDSIGFTERTVEGAGLKAGLFVQASQRVLGGVILTGGLRADVVDLTETSVSVGPRVSASVALGDRTTMNAAAGVYHQTPAFLWLAGNTANGSLSPIRADQYVLGVEHLVRPDLKLRLEGYLKRYRAYPASLDRPYLVLANTGAGFGGSEENFGSYGLDRLGSGGRGMARGLELLLQKKYSEIPVYGLLSVTWGRSLFAALDGVERPGAFDQEWIANLSGGYKPDERWEYSMRFRFATGRPFTPFGSDGTQDPAAYNSGRLGSAYALDLRVDRRWNFARWGLIVYLDVQNVTNNRMTGRVRWNAREGKVETDESAIGILPSIGVSAEF
ncbi:MAG: TonB-dependent receptor [Bacteroidota bacterium]